jgi:hypothetical protein
MALLELAKRNSSGLVVRLLWDDGRNQIVLRYVDARTGDSFATDVPNGSALAAFEHPNLYRPLQDAA